MRKLMMAAVALMFVCSASFGQQRERPSSEDIAKRQTEQMTKSLSLTDDQKSKVEAINLKYAKKQDNAFKSNKEEKQARREEMKKNHEAKDAELKGVLSSEQYVKYQEKQQERKNKAGERGEKRQKGPRSGSAS